MIDRILFTIIVWFCGAIFIGIGIYSIRKKTPIHFWAGTMVKDQEISDIKAYNRENGIMWITYGSTYVLAGLIALISIAIGAVFLAIAGVVGIVFLILGYNSIYNNYKA